MASKECSFSNSKVLFSIVSMWIRRMLMLLSFKEFTSDSSTVSISHFEYLNSVVSTEESDDELSVFIVRLSGE